MGPHAGHQCLCRGGASPERLSAPSLPRRHTGLRKTALKPSGGRSTFSQSTAICVNRCELFDEADLGAALARFEELHAQARRLQNAASQVAERFLRHFAVSDWDAMAEILADDFFNDDRRPRRELWSPARSRRPDGEHAGNRRTSVHRRRRRPSSRPAPRALPSCASASRSVAKVRMRFRSRCWAWLGSIPKTESQHSLYSTPTTSRLPSRSSTPATSPAKAAVHSHTWSVISQAYAALNRRALPATTRDWTNVDHRHFDTIEPNALTPNIRAFWDITSEGRIDVATVHRLTNLGAVVAHATHATSQEGVEIESGEIIILMVDGDLLSRCEIFNEADLDAALARFDELQPQTPRLENTASQVGARSCALCGPRLGRHGGHYRRRLLQ